MMRVDDAPVVAAYRDDPAISVFQDWDIPYTLERAVDRLNAQAALHGPTPGEWVNLAMVLRDPTDAGPVGGPAGATGDGEAPEPFDTPIGDLACHIDETGAVAEIGYTLRTRYQGRGYASEGANALVDHLLAPTGIHRLEGSLDKDNVASMRVLEAVGMTFESLTRQSYPMRGGWEDDLRYAMLRDDRAAWLSRPTTPPASLELVEITPDDAYLWGRLRTHHSQERFVSPMALSFRDALFPEVVDGAPVVPWMRGVLADGERVAFAMLAEITPHHPEAYLWRLLVDRMHQRRGIGRLVIAELQRMLTAQGHRTLLTSWGEGMGSPRRFYEGLGFVPTGNVVEGETEARLSW